MDKTEKKQKNVEIKYANYNRHSVGSNFPEDRVLILVVCSRDGKSLGFLEKFF